MKSAEEASAERLRTSTKVSQQEVAELGSELGPRGPGSSSEHGKVEVRGFRMVSGFPSWFRNESQEVMLKLTPEAGGGALERMG